MKPHDLEDIVLWQSLKKGNVEALGHLYDHFIDELLAYGSQFSQDKQQVMDAIHDLFLNLFKYRKNLADTDNVNYYLCRALKNQILKAPKSKVFCLPNNWFPEHMDAKLSVVSHEEELMDTEFVTQRTLQLSNALEFLSKKQRQCIFLRFTENRQYEEIADIMNVSVQTSRTIIYRAIKVLRANIALFLLLSYIFL
ncbi:MAG: sigma-70 family RNA polymerase sigma factor [Aquaticitalea sp.]